MDITLVEGAVANEDHLREIRLIRRRTRILIAFGDCAVTGNVTALRNLFSVEDVLNRRVPGIRHGRGRAVPAGNDIVPRLLDRVLRIHDVVPVDHFLPGCPPSADTIFAFVADLLAGRTPVRRREEIRHMSNRLDDRARDPDRRPRENLDSVE